MMKKLVWLSKFEHRHINWDERIFYDEEDPWSNRKVVSEWSRLWVRAVKTITNDDTRLDYLHHISWGTTLFQIMREYEILYASGCLCSEIYRDDAGNGFGNKLRFEIVSCAISMLPAIQLTLLLPILKRKKYFSLFSGGTQNLWVSPFFGKKESENIIFFHCLCSKFWLSHWKEKEKKDHWHLLRFGNIASFNIHITSELFQLPKTIAF